MDRSDLSSHEKHDPVAGPTDTDVHCPECDYNLTGATGRRCPWCGWDINLDVLSAVALERSNARRVGAIMACAVCGFGSIIAVLSLVWRSRSLSVYDALAVVGVLIAAVGHFVLAGILIVSGPRWPIYRHGSGQLLRFAGWFSVLLGVIGASALLQPRDVQGVIVSATFEFALAAVLFTLPGVALLVMRMVSFRDPQTIVTAREHDRLSGKQDSETQSPFLVDFFGQYEPDQITQQWFDANRPTTREIDSAIARTWQAVEALAQSSGDKQNLFNGALVRLISHEHTGQVLKLKLGPTTYRDFLGTNIGNCTLALRSGPEYLSNALGISAAVVTSDGYVALGQRGRGVTLHEGALHPFGGMVEQSDRRPDGSCDLFAAIRRELEEELGLKDADINRISLIGLVRDRDILQPELIFDAYLGITRLELFGRFRPEMSQGEHSAIEFLHDEPDAAIPSLNWAGNLTPIAEATYLLHGRACWGEEWYEQTCLVRYGEIPPAQHQPSF
jgi:8-oxo-dGTP pyrophosphatase MutT (NUDIX family)